MLQFISCFTILELDYMKLRFIQSKFTRVICDHRSIGIEHISLKLQRNIASGIKLTNFLSWYAKHATDKARKEALVR